MLLLQHKQRKKAVRQNLVYSSVSETSAVGPDFLSAVTVHGEKSEKETKYQCRGIWMTRCLRGTKGRKAARTLVFIGHICVKDNGQRMFLGTEMVTTVGQQGEQSILAEMRQEAVRKLQFPQLPYRPLQVSSCPVNATVSSAEGLSVVTRRKQGISSIQWLKWRDKDVLQTQFITCGPEQEQTQDKERDRPLVVFAASLPLFSSFISLDPRKDFSVIT